MPNRPSYKKPPRVAVRHTKPHTHTQTYPARHTPAATIQNIDTHSTPAPAWRVPPCLNTPIACRGLALQMQALDSSCWCQAHVPSSLPASYYCTRGTAQQHQSTLQSTVRTAQQPNPPWRSTTADVCHAHTQERMQSRLPATAASLRSTLWRCWQASKALDCNSNSPWHLTQCTLGSKGMCTLG
jgi:hypothetical protein